MTAHIASAIERRLAAACAAAMVVGWALNGLPPLQLERSQLLEETNMILSDGTVTTPTTVRIRCNQNHIFGCGKVDTYPAVTFVIGKDRVRLSGGGRCTCGLPLAVSRNV